VHSVSLNVMRAVQC